MAATSKNTREKKGHSWKMEVRVRPIIQYIAPKASPILILWKIAANEVYELF